MEKLGLKSGIGDVQLSDRLKYDVDIYEFHLEEGDLFGIKLKELKSKIELVLSKGIKVYLHQPMKIQGEFLHINSCFGIENDYLNLSTRILVDLCKEYNLKCVIHINYGTSFDEVIKENIYANKSDYILTVSNMISFLDIFDPERKYILFENGVIGVGGYRRDFILADLLKGTDIPLIMDISHLAISLGEDGFLSNPDEINDYIEETLIKLNNNIHYYHVVDSIAKDGLHDGLSLGEGVIDWSRIKKYIIEKDYIYEVGLKDFNNCIEMIESHNYFKNL